MSTVTAQHVNVAVDIAEKKAALFKAYYNKIVLAAAEGYTGYSTPRLGGPGLTKTFAQDLVRYLHRETGYVCKIKHDFLGPRYIKCTFVRQ